ncbi:MAG: hypothetical protein ACTSPY_16790 [Candidatus Helarchaeota archaeon]
MSEIDDLVERVCDAISELRSGKRRIGGREYIIEDIARLSMNGETSKWEYDNPVIIILDAILTINRNYLVFVRPRILKFINEYGQIRKINDMLELINKFGDEKFSNEVLQYNDQSRLNLLKYVFIKFKEYCEEVKIDNELEGMRKWAKEFKIEKLKDDRIYSIKGIGLSTIQYLRMLLGVNTMMPDRHIKSWVMEVLKIKTISERRYIKILEKASERLNIPCREIVEYIWALKNPKIPELEKRMR